MADTRFKAENGLLVAGDSQLTANVEVGGVLYTTDGGFIANSSVVRTLHPLTIANTAVALANVQVEGTLTGVGIVAVSVDTDSLVSGDGISLVSANTTEFVVKKVTTTFNTSNVTIQEGNLAVSNGDLTVNGSSHTIGGDININQGQFVFTDKDLDVNSGTITMQQASGDFHTIQIGMGSESSGPLRVGANAIAFNWDEASNSSLSNTSYPYATRIAHSQGTGTLTVSSGANTTAANGALDVIDTISIGRTSTTVNTELVVTKAATFSNTVVVNGSQLTANALVVKNTTTTQGVVTLEANATMNVASRFLIGNSTVNTSLISSEISIANSTHRVSANLLGISLVANGALGARVNPNLIDVGNPSGTSDVTTISNGQVGIATPTGSANSIVLSSAGLYANTTGANSTLGATQAKFDTVGGNASLTAAALVVASNTGVLSQYQGGNFSLSTSGAANASWATIQGSATAGSLTVQNGANGAQRIVASTVGDANVQLRVSHATTNTVITPVDIQVAANTTTRTVTNSTAFSVITGTTASNSIVAAFTANATGYPLVSFTSGSANVLLGTAGLTMGNSTSNATVNQTGLWFNGTGIGLANVSIDGSTGTLNLGVSTIYGSGWATFNGNTALGLPFGNTATRPTINRTAYLRYNTETDQLEVSNNASWNYVVTASGAGKASVTAVANTIVQRSTTADIYANNFYSTSDVTLKQNLVQITGALDKLEQITGWMYNFIGDDRTQLGVSAQQVEKTIPEVVGTNEQGLKSVSYQMLIPVIIESIKELKQKLDEITDGGKNKPRN